MATEVARASKSSFTVHALLPLAADHLFVVMQEGNSRGRGSLQRARAQSLAAVSLAVLVLLMLPDAEQQDRRELFEPIDKRLPGS